MASDQAELVSRIYNAAWMVRNYARGGRSTIQKRERDKAIHDMGLAVREAFIASEDFEPLLAAVVDGLRPRDEQPF